MAQVTAPYGVNMASGRQAARRERAGAAAVGLLLLTLATLGCSTSSDDEASPAIEEPASTTATAPPVEETQPQLETEPNAPEPSPTTSTVAPTTTTPPTTTAPPTTTTTTTTTTPPSPTPPEARFKTIDSHPNLVKQRLVPWGEGFLHIGFPRISDESCESVPPKYRFSTDGAEWTEFVDLGLPSVHSMPPLISGLEYPWFDHLSCWIETHRPSFHVSSDGNQLVVASQWPRYLDTWPANIDEHFERLNRILEVPPTVHVSRTTDLQDWDTVSLLNPRPEGLHDSLLTAPSLVGLSWLENGWMVAIETVTFMEFYPLLPDEIREPSIEVMYWYDDNSLGDLEQGITIEWWTEETADPNIQFFTWEELGTTEQLYWDYGFVANKPYHPNDRYSGSIWIATWGENPTRIDLPYISGGERCCRTIKTDAGYIGLSDPEVAGYNPSWWGSGELVFSADGRNWSRIASPSPRDHWGSSISAVDGGVIFSSIEPADDEEDPLAGTTRHWIGAPDGSNWQPIELPEGMSLIEWLMANDRAPTDWPRMAVQGNVVLRISYDGRIDRYVAPE